MCRILLNFWVLFNRGFCSTASLFKFCFFSECTQKNHKTTFFLSQRAFRLKDFAKFHDIGSTDSESTCFSNYANLHHFSSFLVDITACETFFCQSLRVKVDENNFNQEFKFYLPALIDSLLQSLMEARDEPACF